MIKKIYLASRSPRRAELLQQMGIDFEVLPSDIDEAVAANESPAEYVLRLAKQKAQACVTYMEVHGLPILPILAADTTVAVDHLILGKPVDDKEAANMLRMMSGRCHEVHTAVAVINGGVVEAALSTTLVEMSELSEALIQAYVASGEPRDKAGAYGIQGLASTFIKRIDGSYSGVMGLPFFETAALLKNVGVHVL
ncbi:septum formation protein Maf [Methylovorus sp. MM2]|uniref:Maf family protein n=1 Tax=Methylovorus sp. MM2 TaxID=1848038 RepID=UPI0007E2657A|nr:Maf family protein [Methylovorus sp. MM2]OAM51381.1 septum formation protein Maf [Methylovorus sp. MM2]